VGLAGARRACRRRHSHSGGRAHQA